MFTCKHCYLGEAMSKPVAVRIADDTYSRLKNLANLTGRTASYYIHAAIEEHIEDLEDIYLSELAIENLRKGEDKTISSKEFWHDLEN